MAGTPRLSTTNMFTDRGRFATMSAAPHPTVRGFVLLIPGVTGSKEDYEPILPFLATAGWQAVAYDQRGQYETPGGDAASYTLEELESAALSITAAASPPGVRRHLVGHSFGGLGVGGAGGRAPGTAGVAVGDPDVFGSGTTGHHGRRRARLWSLPRGREPSRDGPPPRQVPHGRRSHPWPSTNARTESAISCTAIADSSRPLIRVTSVTPESLISRRIATE